ncbi:MAG: sigma-54-dependent Fis family transcriptional regulator [bacterium]|nr:sigma-54-dependent Fis family transcriptional regulator [bacterium]
MRKVLVIDDDRAILNFMRIFLLQSGKYRVKVLQDSTQAYDLLEQEHFDVLLLDMDMPHVTGMDILKHVKENNIRVVTLVLTGVEDIDLAINAMKLGATDYMLKPIDEQKLLDTLDTAVSNLDISKDEDSGQESVTLESYKQMDAFKHIITQDEKMLKIFHVVEKFSETDNSVLIWGESGTGKEYIARAIHELSPRKDKKFVAVNAGAFANELFASEFFGHAKGSFTGAVADKKGFMEEAHGGTLFLDEIGELTLPIQVKLLRVLQEEEFYRIGSTKNIKADVRIIAATNKNLFDEINRGSFRKDLFFRLNINSINLPPLREREGDIPLLARHFLKLFSQRYEKKIEKISTPVLNLLKGYGFPGNIRELMNIVNSAIIVEPAGELQKKSLPNYFLENTRTRVDAFQGGPLKSLQEVEKEHIKKVLTHTRNNKTQSAKILGISRVNLIAKIKKYELEQV